VIVGSVDTEAGDVDMASYLEDTSGRLGLKQLILHPEAKMYRGTRESNPFACL
jgi:hypothetical protein